jgi:hypothetical protein
MNRAELESTAPINRDELTGLLNAMTPAEQQPITARVRVADIDAELARQLCLDAAPDAVPPETQSRAARKAVRAAKKAAKKAAKRAAKSAPTTAEPAITEPAPAEPATTEAAQDAEAGGRLFNDVDWDELLTAAVSAMVTPKPPRAVPPPIPKQASETRPKRKPTAPFAQVAALLQPYEPSRFPRSTRPPPVRATTQNGTVAESPLAKKAAQAVADVRARLDSADESATERTAAHERALYPSLSPHVVAHLSGEEIAMLPMEIRLTLPEVAGWQAPPRIEMTPVPGPVCIQPHVAPANESRMVSSAAVQEPSLLRFATVIASFGVTFLAGICALYFLL